MAKKTISQKERELLDKISKAKSDLNRLQKKQKQEIGSLAYKHGLNSFELPILDKAFEKLAGELAHGHSSTN